MLVRLIPLLLLLVVLVALYVLLQRARAVGRDPGPARGGVGPDGNGAPVDAGDPVDAEDRHARAVQTARELVRQAEAAHARAVARAQERLTLAELEAQRDADGGRAEQRVEAARRELAAVRADTEELDRARMTLEDLEGAGPLRGDLPPAPEDDRNDEQGHDPGRGRSDDDEPDGPPEGTR